MPRSFGILVGSATSICGASAALAVAAVLPPNPNRARQLAFSILAATALSTLAMALYPILVLILGLDTRQSGFIIGASIHDVAQVVGAGYPISDDAGAIAILDKLFPVILLVAVVITAGDEEVVTPV